MNERTLPHNLDAERSVLGAILLRNDAINAAVEVLQPEDFYRDAHQLLLEHMIQLSERGAAIDLVTLAESLTRADALEKVGGPAYITRLVDGVPRTTNIEHYAQIVKEKATLRRLITEASKIASDAYDADRDASEILDEAERSIFSIADARIGEGFTPLSELVDSALDTVEKLQQFKSLVTGVPTGFYDLDHKTSGMQPSDLVIIAARPSMGKTSFVINMAQNAALEHGKTVGIFSLEMSKEQLFMRMLTSEARVDSQRLRQGMLLERDSAGDRAGRREALDGEDLHRRQRLDRRPRDARQGAAPQGRARARHARHRLRPADAGTRPLREPAAGADQHLAVAQGAGQGTARAGADPVAAQSCARCARRSPPAALGPA